MSADGPTGRTRQVTGRKNPGHRTTSCTNHFFCTEGRSWSSSSRRGENSQPTSHCCHLPGLQGQHELPSPAPSSSACVCDHCSTDRKGTWIQQCFSNRFNKSGCISSSDTNEKELNLLSDHTFLLEKYSTAQRAQTFKVQLSRISWGTKKLRG